MSSFRKSKYLLLMIYTIYSGKPTDRIPALIKVSEKDPFSFKVEDVLRDNYAFRNGIARFQYNDIYIDIEPLKIPSYNFDRWEEIPTTNYTRHIKWNTDNNTLELYMDQFRVVIKQLEAEDDTSAVLLYDTCMEELINEFRSK